jgi:Uma2 family endonuclease
MKHPTDLEGLPRQTGERASGEPSFAPQGVTVNYDDLIIQDDTPLDSIFVEKQERLLTEPLYHSWEPPGEQKTFVALANVGLFDVPKNPCLVPDVMLSVGVRIGDDPSLRTNNSYYTWVMGKPPDVVIEFVSDRMGAEESFKFREYAAIGVPYYVIFDPRDLLGLGVLNAFVNSGGVYQPTDPAWLAPVGLGLRLWEGEYTGMTVTWLRWCERDGTLIPNGLEAIRARDERIAQEQQLAAQARQDAGNERLRAEQSRKDAEQERRRAEQSRKDAEQERAKRELLAAKLRELGVDPEGL